jgi:hypothetical protein
MTQRMRAETRGIPMPAKAGAPLVPDSRMKETIYEQTGSKQNQQETNPVKPTNTTKSGYNQQCCVSFPLSKFSVPDGLLKGISAVLTFALNHQSVHFASDTNNQRHVTPLT